MFLSVLTIGGRPEPGWPDVSVDWSLPGRICWTQPAQTRQAGFADSYALLVLGCGSGFVGVQIPNPDSDPDMFIFLNRNLSP